MRDELLQRARPFFDAGEGAGEGAGDSPTIPWSEKSSTIATGTEIGPYHVLERLGRGGFAEVFLARQTRPFERRVALKILKRGMETQAVLARFAAERQALALMDHPCIAKVFDAGETEDGRPYFVLEHVPGVRITRHCDDHELGIRERLELFVRVCEGIQHAHERAVVHRDIKPSNVLVAVVDGVATPRIIDFGIAKAMAQPLTDRTIYTESGQVIGTPGYMSPEQMEGTAGGVDGRTDVYSLGVLLYELLTGLPPFDPAAMGRLGFDGIRRVVREVDPPKPSTRLHEDRDRLMQSARARGTSARALVGEIRGDLDWVAMKALEKDRDRRYGSPRELAEDIGRHLRNEPVAAGPPGIETRVRKFLRRHRPWSLVPWLVLAVIGVLLLLRFAIPSGGRFEATLSGSVVDANAQPVPGAQVTVDGYPFLAITSTEGEFRGGIEADQRGDEVLIRVSHELFESSTRWVPIESARIDTLTFRLQAIADE